VGITISLDRKRYNPSVPEFVLQEFICLHFGSFTARQINELLGTGSHFEQYDEIYISHSKPRLAPPRSLSAAHPQEPLDFEIQHAAHLLHTSHLYLSV